MIKDKFIEIGLQMIKINPDELMEAMAYLSNCYGHEVNRLD